MKVAIPRGKGRAATFQALGEAILSTSARSGPRGRKAGRRKQQRLQHELRERQRELEERVSRSAAPRDDDAPPPRID
jgi:hypothetical protein